MPLLMRKMAILAKREVTYGVDPTPTGAANAILARNVQPTPLTTVKEARELAREYLGNSSDVLGAFYGGLQFEVEAAGAGTAGTVPGYSALMRACGFAEVVTAGTSVTYTPVSGSFDSVTLYLHLDGVLHKFLGARGNLGGRFNNRSAAMWLFNFTGLFVPVTDGSMPVSVYTAFRAPLAVNTANTPTWTIHGVNGSVLRNFTFDMANSVQYRNLVNSEAVRILDRRPVGTLEMQAELMAVKNWFQSVRNADEGAVQLVHGTTAGNIIEINAPKLQLSDITYGDFEGDAMLQAQTKFMPNAGNDEISIVVR